MDGKTLAVILTVVGALFFRESLTAYEVLGLLMAIGSLFLLIRFA